MNKFNNKYIFKHSLSLLIILLFLVSIFNIGYSSWNLVNNYFNNKIGNNINDYVCFNSKTNIKYYMIEDALNNANSGDTIYCYKDKNPTIYSNVVINSGVTLTLPISRKDEFDWDGRQKEAKTSNTWREIGEYTSNQFADQDEASVNKYLVNRVTLASNVTLTNFGTINIGGIVGNDNTVLAGNTSGYYCELYLNKGARIINKNTGIIDCLGYIKEDSNNRGAILENYGIVKLPMVFYDYKGGGCTASLYANETYKEFPLSQYDFPNIKIEQNHYYGCKMIGYVDLFTGYTQIEKEVLKVKVRVTMNARHNVSEINFISQEEASVFKIRNDGYINLIYKSNDNKFTNYNTYNSFVAGPNAETIFTFNANVDFNYFEISLNASNDAKVETRSVYIGGWSNSSLLTSIVKNMLKTSMQTKEVDYPIPWNFSITVNSGYNLNFNQRIKFLGGSELIIKEESTVNINSPFILYDSSNNDKKLYEDERSPAGTIYPYDKGDALLINEGTLNINNGAKFGGNISAISSLGTLNINNGSILEYETQEGSATFNIVFSSLKNMGVNYEFQPYKNSPIHKYACVDLYNTFNLTNVEVGTYIAIKGNNNQYGYKKV